MPVRFRCLRDHNRAGGDHGPPGRYPPHDHREVAVLRWGAGRPKPQGIDGGRWRDERGTHQHAFEIADAYRFPLARCLVQHAARQRRSCRGLRLRLARRRGRDRERDRPRHQHPNRPGPYLHAVLTG
ncbi:MAG: hypothetical protein DMF88_14275 [Acidobacteria bacterium]|nr:MAG: hypothetical protein DMF88_14275 [Acidobacteriota bacterium]